ncbi:hypothetical protein [Mucilaginibacter sp. PAMB04168]|uniref:hypothetical protein n=1 Tax=Mucilaginibacter sp. PAMB04168 TaxID=3138567 RepID=UPI0031F60169
MYFDESELKEVAYWSYEDELLNHSAPSLYPIYTDLASNLSHHYGFASLHQEHLLLHSDDRAVIKYSSVSKISRGFQDNGTQPALSTIIGHWSFLTIQFKCSKANRNLYIRFHNDSGGVKITRYYTFLVRVIRLSE